MHMGIMMCSTIQGDGINKLTNSRPKVAVAPKDLSKAPMKPNLMVMFFASTESGNKMEDRECLVLTRWSRPSRPIFRMGRREALEGGLRSKTKKVKGSVTAFIMTTNETGVK